jgi:hypothetical protein
MIFFIIIALFIAAIAFFHFTQGFFSATLSAIFAVFAAVIAISYHEWVIESFAGGRFGDEIHAIMLLLLFAVAYIIPRSLIDSFIPGSVSLPAGLDKAGAAIMGIIAGVCGAGIMTIAAQELPFGPTIFGYARFDVQDDREVRAQTSGRALDRQEYTELTASQPGQFGTEPHGHGLPFFPVDDIVMGLTYRLSEGALSAGKPMKNLHPDFLDELFGQRLGIEPGGKHVAMNLPNLKLDAMEVQGIYTRSIPASAQHDGDQSSLRTGNGLKPVPVPPNSNDTFLVIRVTFKLQAADGDRLFRLSPGSARLVVNTAKPGSGEEDYENLYPVGTLQDASLLFLNKPDDFIFLEADHGVDLVYRVSKRLFDQKVPPGTFLEVKRLARVDLGGMEIKPGPKKDLDFNPLRKSFLVAPETPAAPGETPAPPTPAPAPADATPPTPTPTPSPTPAPNAGGNAFAVASAVASDTIGVVVSAPDGAEVPFTQIPGGTAIVSSGKLKNSTVLDTTTADQNMPQKIAKFFVPENQTIIQIQGTPPNAAPWGFMNEPEQYELVDDKGAKYQPYGFVASYTLKGAPHYSLRYLADATIPGSTPPDGVEHPTSVTLIYLVPTGANITEFDDHGKKSKDISVGK